MNGVPVILGDEVVLLNDFRRWLTFVARLRLKEILLYLKFSAAYRKTEIEIDRFEEATKYSQRTLLPECLKSLRLHKIPEEHEKYPFEVE